MDKGKQHAEEGFQHKWKRVVSVESKEFVPDEGLKVDARRVGLEDEFFIINPNADPTGQLADVADHCQQPPLHFRLPVQWLNECLNKAYWKELR